VSKVEGVLCSSVVEHEVMLSKSEMTRFTAQLRDDQVAVVIIVSRFLGGGDI
jgi:hypothetical protein